MLLICAILVFSIIVNIVLLLNISYKNYCIDDLEQSKYARTREFVRILLELKEYQKFEPAGRDTCTKRCLNEAIEKYATKKIKKELNMTCGRANV